MIVCGSFNPGVWYMIIWQVGTISANGEREIGELIARAMERVGRDGVITIQVSNLPIDTLSFLTVTAKSSIPNPLPPCLVAVSKSFLKNMDCTFFNCCRMEKHCTMSWKLLRAWSSTGVTYPLTSLLTRKTRNV